MVAHSPLRFGLNAWEDWVQPPGSTCPSPAHLLTCQPAPHSSASTEVRPGIRCSSSFTDNGVLQLKGMWSVHFLQVRIWLVTFLFHVLAPPTVLHCHSWPLPLIEPEPNFCPNLLICWTSGTMLLPLLTRPLLRWCYFWFRWYCTAAGNTNISMHRLLYITLYIAYYI